MKKATIYDYARMCKSYGSCRNCPLKSKNATTNMKCWDTMLNHPDQANEIILKWCDEHPVETRQDRFLKMFPNAKIDVNGVLECCPKSVNKNFACIPNGDGRCIKCAKDYWSAEVDENG